MDQERGRQSSHLDRAFAGHDCHMSARRDLQLQIDSRGADGSARHSQGKQAVTSLHDGRRTAFLSAVSNSGNREVVFAPQLGNYAAARILDAQIAVGGKFKPQAGFRLQPGAVGDGYVCNEGHAESDQQTK